VKELGFLLGSQAGGFGGLRQEIEGERGFPQLMNAIRAAAQEMLVDLRTLLAVERAEKEKLVNVI